MHTQTLSRKQTEKKNQVDIYNKVIYPMIQYSSIQINNINKNFNPPK